MDSRRILYVNHTGLMSGAERWLLDLLGGLPPEVDAVVACPQGDLSEACREIGLETVAIPGTSASLRLHPVNTPVGVAGLAGASWRIRQISRGLNADLVHANSARAALAAVGADRVGGRPVIAHIHDAFPPSRLAAATLRVIGAGSETIVANSAYTAARLRRQRSCPVRVIHNPVDSARFDPELVERETTRAQLGLRPGETVLTVVAQLTPWKGQDDAVRILARLKPTHPDLRLLLVGSAKFTAAGTRFDNLAYERSLRALIGDLGLERDVVFCGERDDVPALLRASDLVLVPSWQEPFGRIVTEAMAMKVAVVATNVGGPPEIVREGVDGLLLPPREPERWAEAIDGLLRDPELRMRMGESGRARAASEFGLARHVEQILAMYDEVLGQVPLRRSSLPLP